MGQRDNLPNENSPPSSQAADVILQNLTQDLQALQRSVSSQLGQDIERLQSQKRRLMDDIEALEGDYDELRSRYQTLQTSHDAALSQQQQLQQQLWAKRLAQALATHLHARLADTLTTSLGTSLEAGGSGGLPQTHHVLSSLDTTLHSTLHSLQQDLNSYQSSLSQQIGRMHSLEQQGEAILDALVNRLSHQLQSQLVASQPATPWQNGHTRIDAASSGRPLSYPEQPATYPAAPAALGSNGHGAANYGPSAPDGAFSPRKPSTAGEPLAPAPALPKQRDSFKQGLLFVVCATLALSFHNVIVGLIGYGGNLFGQIAVNGIFPLNIPNSLMLLWLRMIVVVPLTAVVANHLYPSLWGDVRGLFSQPNRRPLRQVIASGAFLFLSQVLIYKAISDIGPGVAVTLLFMYPLIVVPLGWLLFGKRSTTLQFVVMGAITMGIVFTALPRIYFDLARRDVSAWGIGAALLSSAAFALYLVAMDLSFRQELPSNQKLHPAPVSLIQFLTIFVLTSLTLIIGSFFGLQPSQPSSSSGLYLGGLLLGVLTLLGYLFNNYAVRCMGSSQTAIVAASGPAVTALMAYLLTPGEKSTLQFIQWIGVILVTLGVVSLSFERLAREQREKAAKAQAARAPVS